MVLGIVLIGGCGDGRVVYDAVGGEDAVDDLVYAMVLFGTTEGDAEQIRGPHVAGGSLTINARRAHSIGGLQWFATTLAPEIAEVVAADTTGSGLTIEIAFHRAGTTDLFVVDENDVIIDVQPLQVRDPVEAALVPWDDLAAGDDTPLDGTVHLVGGSATSLAVTWRDETGAALRGVNLLQLDGSGATTGVSVWTEFTGEVDVVNLDVDRDAPTAVFPITLGSDLVTFERQVEIHDRAEVDRLELLESTNRDGDGGFVKAEVFAGGERLVGAPVVFRYDDQKAEGTGLTWAEGPTTTVEACFDQRCETLLLRGKPTAITGALADPAGCGCRSAPGGAGTTAAALGAALLLTRRGRRRRAGPDRR